MQSIKDNNANYWIRELYNNVVKIYSNSNDKKYYIR